VRAPEQEVLRRAIVGSIEDCEMRQTELVHISIDAWGHRLKDVVLGARTRSLDKLERPVFTDCDLELTAEAPVHAREAASIWPLARRQWRRYLGTIDTRMLCEELVQRL